MAHFTWEVAISHHQLKFHSPMKASNFRSQYNGFTIGLDFRILLRFWVFFGARDHFHPGVKSGNLVVISDTAHSLIMCLFYPDTCLPGEEGDGISSCRRCPKGFYKASSGRGKCTACDIGYSTLKDGTLYPESCISEYLQRCLSEKYYIQLMSYWPNRYVEGWQLESQPSQTSDL